MSATYKNTINNSKIDAYIEILKDLKISYKVCNTISTTIDQDSYLGPEKITLRKLTYNNYIVLEKIIFNKHPELDDKLESIKFENDEPENFQYIEVKNYIYDSSDDEVPW